MAIKPEVLIYNRTASDIVDISNIPVTIIAPSSGGTATAGVLVKNATTKTCDALFGPQSIASASVKAFKAINPNQDLYIFPVADPVGGVKAAATQTLTGTATKAGKYKLTIEGRVYEFSFNSGDDGQDVFDGVRTAIAADTNAMVVATGTTTLILTHFHAGLVGNRATIESYIYNTDGEVDNCGFTFAGAVAFTGGTGLPLLTTLAYEIEDIQTHVVYDDYDTVTDNTLGINLIDLVSTRGNAVNRLTYGNLFFYIPVSSSAWRTKKNSNAKYLSQFICPYVEKRTTSTNIKGDLHGNASCTMSTRFVAMLTAFLNSNSNILLINPTNSTSSLYGNIKNLTKNLSGLVIPTLNATSSIKDDFTFEEIDEWSALGVTVGRSNGTSIEIANTGYTTSEKEASKYLSTALVQAYIQQLQYTALKGIKFQNRNVSPQLLSDIKVALVQVIENACNDGILVKEELRSMIDKLSVVVNPSKKTEVLAVSTISVRLPNTGITLDITYTTSILS
jgi:hypothetical protein